MIPVIRGLGQIPLPRGRQGDIMTVKRMDNVGIVVEDLDAAIAFFTELGLELEGRTSSQRSATAIFTGAFRRGLESA
jgi:hypothetical protein